MSAQLLPDLPVIPAPLMGWRTFLKGNPAPSSASLWPAPALVVGGWLMLTMWSVWNNWAPDLSALYMAARFFWQGEFAQIYGAPEGFFGPDIPERWQQLVAQLGFAGKQALPYAYPPLWAALFSPLAGNLRPLAFFNLFYLIQVPMLAGMIWLSWRLMQPARISPTIWALLSVLLLQTSFIPLFALYHDQPQISVAFLTLLAMERHLKGRGRTAGIALGIAAAIKISPALFALVFLVGRDWRALKWFTLTGAATVLASFALAGPALHWAYLERIRGIADSIAGMNVNWALESALYQLGLFLRGEAFARNGWEANIWAEPAWIGWTVRASLAALLGAVYALGRRADLQARMRALPMAMTIIVAATGPLGWTHYYLPVVLLLPGLLGQFSPWRALAVFVTFALLLNKGVSYQLHQIETEYYLPMLIGLLSMLCLLGIQLFWLARAGASRRIRAGAPQELELAA